MWVGIEPAFGFGVLRESLGSGWQTGADVGCCLAAQQLRLSPVCSAPDQAHEFPWRFALARAQTQTDRFAFGKNP